MKTEKFEELFKEEYEKNNKKADSIFKEAVESCFNEDCKVSLPKALSAVYESAYLSSCQFTHDVLKRLLCEEKTDVEQ